MKILLVGSGGREHALAWKLRRSPLVDELLLWPGNPAFYHLGRRLDLPASAPWESLVEVAKNESVDFVVIGPEKPLAEGLSDLCAKAGLPVFGPNQQAAQLESSKAFAKEVMAAAGIPTASFCVVSDIDACRMESQKMLSEKGGTVIKASGLASGKGVFVCRSEEDIDQAIERLFGSTMAKAAETIVIEEILEGRECYYYCFIGVDGSSSLGFAVDFKRLKDGDIGPNTGGMGSYSPVPWLPEDAGQQVDSLVVKPLLSELKKRGLTYQGCLYVGLMWNEKGPSVVEFNVRLGDPEAQVLAVRDQRDWAAMIAHKLGLKGTLKQSFDDAINHNRAAVGVVLASSSYPYGEHPSEGKVLDQVHFEHTSNDEAIFAAAVQSINEQIVSGEGRILTAVAAADHLSTARQKAYEKLGNLTKSWDGVQYRKDIAEKVSPD